MIYWLGGITLGLCHTTELRPGEIILFKVIANICTTLEPYKAQICLKHSKTNIEPQPPPLLAVYLNPVLSQCEGNNHTK